MSENGYPVSGMLNMLINKSLPLKQVEDAINQYIEISAKRGYAEGIVDGLRRDRPPQEDEKDVPRDVIEEGVQMDQLKRWSAYKQGVLE